MKNCFKDWSQSIAPVECVFFLVGSLFCGVVLGILSTLAIILLFAFVVAVCVLCLFLTMRGPVFAFVLDVCVLCLFLTMRGPVFAFVLDVCVLRLFLTMRGPVCHM